MIIEWLQKRFEDEGVVNVPLDKIKELLEYPTDPHVWYKNGHLHQLCFENGKITYRDFDKRKQTDEVIVLDNLYETINDMVEALEIQGRELND